MASRLRGHRRSGCEDGRFALSAARHNEAVNQEEIDLLLTAAGDVKNGRTRSHVGAAALLAEGVERLVKERAEPAPIAMWLSCPHCKARHIDEGDFATKPHHTHACQSCGLTWRPSIVPTVGVLFLPGFKNEPPPYSHFDHPEELYQRTSEEMQERDAQAAQRLRIRGCSHEPPHASFKECPTNDAWMYPGSNVPVADPPPYAVALQDSHPREDGMHEVLVAIGPGTPAMVTAWNRANQIFELWLADFDHGIAGVGNIHPKAKDDLVRKIALALLEKKT